MNCNYCELHKTATNVLIPFRGQYRKPKILFVGIAPGPQEDKEGKCFIGPSGDLLREVLRELHIPEEDVAYDNMVHCWPHNIYTGTRDPDQTEILTCIPYLYRAIKASDPDVIVTLGALTWNVLMDQNTVVTEIRGRVDYVEIYGKLRKVVGTYHPAASLRQGKKRGPHGFYDMIVADVKYAWDHACGLFYLPEWEIINDTDEAVSYIEEAVRLYKAREIDFAAFDSETPQLILKQKERREMGIEMISSDLWDARKRILGFSMSYVPRGLVTSGPPWTWAHKVKGVYVAMDHFESKVNYQAVGYTLKWAFDRDGEVKLPSAFHNHKYDSQWEAEKLGFLPINYHDTMLGSFVLYGTSRAHGLGGITHDVLKYEVFKDDTEELLAAMPAESRSFSNLPLQNLGRRGAIDAAGTATLVVVEHEMIRHNRQTVVMDLMNEFSEACTEMELRGACIDYQKHQEHITNYPKLMQEAKDDVMTLPMVQRYIEDRRTLWTPDKKNVPRPPNPKFAFNINSPDHKYDLLYRYYNLPTEFAELTASSTDENPVFSTNENSRHLMTLHVRDEKYEGKCQCRCHVAGWDTDMDWQFAADQPPIKIRTWVYHTPQNYVQYGINPHEECYNFLVKIRMYSKLRKVYNDYMVKITNYFRPLDWQARQQIPDTLRVISFNYILHWTKTGRLSTRDWAVHTEPWHSDVRRLHVSRWKDWGGMMLSADYSQLELRIAAAIARDQKLIEVYEARKDVHRHTASKVYKLPEDQITQAMRRYSKTMSFRLIYGGGAQSIADETGLSVAEAQVLLEGFLAEYTGIDASIKNFHDMVQKFGFVITPMMRKFFLPDIYSDKRGEVAGALRDSQNYPIQSSSSDLTMTAIVLVRRALRKYLMNSYVWAMIHDAIESDLYPGELLKYYQILKHSMEKEVREMYDWVCVPLEAEFEIGVRWDGAVTVKSLDAERMVVKGRRRFYEETMEYLSRAYQFEAKVTKETYVGMHRGCGGDINVDNNVCSKCKQVTRGQEDVDVGETLILRKSFEGDNGGITEVSAEIAWRQTLATV